MIHLIHVQCYAQKIADITEKEWEGVERSRMSTSIKYQVMWKVVIPDEMNG